MPAPGEQKEQIIKENYPVLGDSGRTLCEVENTKAQDRMHNIIRLWRVMIFRNGIRNRNGCLERLDGRAAGSSTTNRNFPGLRMMQKKDALEWSAESSAKMSRRQSIRSPRE